MPIKLINKKIGFLGLGLLSGLILLAWFSSGPMEPAQKIESPGLTIPAGGEMRIDTRPLPMWWQEFDLWVRCDPSQDRTAIRAFVRPAKTQPSPSLKGSEEVLFRLRVNNLKTSDLYLINSGHQPLRIEKMEWKNYSVINTEFPRYVLLLSPFPGSGFPFSILLVSLGTALLMIWNLALLDQRSRSRDKQPCPAFWGRGTSRSRLGRPKKDIQRMSAHENRQVGLRTCFRISYGFQWGSVLLPWLILFLALGLRLRGSQLLLSWEALPVLALPGYLYWGLTSRFFKEKIVVPLLVFLMAATFTVLLGTVLGVGLPVRDFGPQLIYQTHFTQTARYAGLIYLVLFLLLYRMKKEWFSPGRHLILSSIWMVFLPLLIVYLANGYTDYGDDTTFNSLLPWRIVQGEGLFFSPEYVQTHGSWGLSAVGDAFLPNFPMGPGFFGLPTALVQYFWSGEPVSRLIAWNQKVTAVWVAALSAAIIYQMIYLISRKSGLTLLLSSAFALGTTQPSISAAVLWQHGPAVLLICLGLFFVVKGRQQDPSYYPLAALPLAFLSLVRPQAFLFYLAGLATVAALQPKMIIRFFFWSLPGIAATLWINLGLYHALLGGYAYQASGDNFVTPLLEGALGSLFSPNRGLLVFSPFLVLGIIGGAILWARRSFIAIAFGLAALLFFIIHAKYGHWHGGWCVAPRFSSELVPVLVLFSAYWFLKFNKFRARLIGWALIFISIAINLPGSFFLNEQGAWNLFPNVDNYRQERIWDFEDWLPFHYTYWLKLERFKEVPAFPFVMAEEAEPLRSKSLDYRVKVNLNPKPLEVIRLDNIALKEGAYQVLFKGDSQKAKEARAEIILGIVGYKVEEKVLPLDPQPAFTLSPYFKVEREGKVDIRFKVSGNGFLILDTVRIIPVQNNYRSYFVSPNAGKQDPIEFSSG